MRRSGLKYEHIISFALDHPWAITPPMLERIAGILAGRIVGEDADEDAIGAALQAKAARAAAAPANGTVAVIPIHGVIAPRMNLLSEMSGGTTFEGLTEQLHEALARPGLQAIVLDVDSPGGNVAGASEFAREVLAARTKVPIIAQANHQMCSAAYWPASCATEVVASPSALVGSIGVFAIHDDISKALEQRGVKRDVIAAGKYKAEGVDGGALAPEARAHRLSIVDSAYQRFVGDVAKGRGVTADLVRSGYGEGRALDAEQALGARLIDRIATFAETLARFTSAPAGAGSGRAHDLDPAVTAQESREATTAQEPRIADAARVAVEQRWLALERDSL